MQVIQIDKLLQKFHQVYLQYIWNYHRYVAFS